MPSILYSILTSSKEASLSNQIQPAYIIDHEGLILEIAIIDSSKLFLHEETIPEQLEKLKSSLKESRILQAPIIVDRNSMVVLDGMHRVTALREIGCKLIMVCLVDYLDSRITLGRWCRTISKPFNYKIANEIFSEHSLGIAPAYGINPMHSPDAFLAFGSGSYKIDGGERDIVSLFRELYSLEIQLQSKGYQIGHKNEDDAVRFLALGDVSALLCPPLVTKQQVVEIAASNRVFSPKSTRHKLPARPVGISIPISMLSDVKLTPVEVNRKLALMLANKSVRKLPPDSSYFGRKYDETLYVFD